MRPGYGKLKGGAWEREVAVKLSLWVTGGRRKDCFWRSAMSGGRATMRGTAVRQCGDICAVAPEGHWFTDQYFTECKHVKDLSLLSFFLREKGTLAKFWHTAEQRAARHHRQPLLIAKQNNLPAIIIIQSGDPIGDACWQSCTVFGAAAGWFTDMLKLNPHGLVHSRFASQR